MGYSGKYQIYSKASGINVMKLRSQIDHFSLNNVLTKSQPNMRKSKREVLSKSVFPPQS